MHDAPQPFEALLPSPSQQAPLLLKAHDLARSATQLAGLPIAPGLQELLRGMNAYSTNRIGKVRFGLPLHALRFYFPALWPDAEGGL